MERKQAPGRWSINWAVVVIAGVITFGGGLLFVSGDNGGGPAGGIVVPQPGPMPSGSAQPLRDQAVQIEPAAGSVTATKPRTTGTSSTSRRASTTTTPPPVQQPPAQQPPKNQLPDFRTCVSGGPFPGAGCFPTR